MSDIPIENLIKETKSRMNKALEALKENFGSVRTGKASPALVENLPVEYYGTTTRIRDIASITTPEPRLLVIQPWDQNAVKSIEKTVTSSNLGISPASDGRVIRLTIPELSEERRAEYGKLVKKQAEEARVEIRNIRREANDAAKKAENKSEITEDDLADMLEQIQKLTDDSISKIDQLLEEKTAELMRI